MPDGPPPRNETGLRRPPLAHRRTWPQRLVIVASLVVIIAAVASAETVNYVEEVWEEYRPVQFPAETVQYGRELLRPDTEPGEPVNFLVVGTDSSIDVRPDTDADGAAGGRALADVIMLIRLDPGATSASVLSIPRDLWAEIPGAQDHKINSALLIGGAPLLVETVRSMFDVEINHYIEMDFTGFEQVVDSLGGVPVWFPHPARDPKSDLNIETSGCHVLDGEQALQYVRSRTYTEFIDGRWRITGGNDFARIARQQDFLVLALDRAISRGARNPTTIVSMIDAGAAFVAFDQDLTLGELVSLAQDFSDFNPENLQRQSLEVYTLFWPDGRYKGEAAYQRANESVLDVFRGVEDAASPAEVTLRVAGFNQFNRAEAVAALAGEGFTVVESLSAGAIPETVVLHGPDDAEAALTVARYLDPVPYAVADDDVAGVMVVLGADYRGVLFLAQQPLSVVRDQVESRGYPEVLPDPASGFEPAAAAAPVQPMAAAGASTSSRVEAAVFVVAQPADEDPAPVSILGRPPPGESCG